MRRMEDYERMYIQGGGIEVKFENLKIFEFLKSNT